MTVSTESKTVVIKHRAMEIYRGSEGIVPCILNLDKSCR